MEAAVATVEQKRVLVGSPKDKRASGKSQEAPSAAMKLPPKTDTVPQASGEGGG